MEAIADKVIGLLGYLASPELELICNFQDDLESMKSMVTAIKAVLLDAETKATKSHLINDWLQKLKDVLLDADDLLDAYLADELAREVMNKGKMMKEVRIFFTKSNRIVSAAKMGRKIKDIKKKLDGISIEKNPLNLIQISSIESNYEWRETQSFVREEDVVGRDEERKRPVSTLKNPPDAVKNNVVSVVAIVGIGGLGKTTLAQQVYNDEAIKSHFELMKWVCVSDDESTDNKFHIKRVAQKIVGQEYGALDQVAKGLRNMIEGKRFLLVLDDVWNENCEKWLELESLLRGGRKGSMIIMTTRSEKVAQIMGTHPQLLFSIEVLDANNSWGLFRREAFQDGKELDNQELVGIGKDIVRKCAGVPLAIRTIGCLLLTEKSVSKWSYFRDHAFANVGSDGNRILSILKLSYDHLPSHLKNCFAFCSLFPKDYEIKRQVLIQMWIAEGFIQPLDTNRRLEDVGDEYFMQLLSRCLFQDVRRGFFGEIKQCKMHDLIHDLAQSITKNECYIVKSKRIEEENIGDGIRHVSNHFDGAWKFQFGNVKVKKVRTILSPTGSWGLIPSRSSSIFLNPICQSTTSLPKHLRVLDLRNGWWGIPKSIGDLKHLRYLDLSGTEGLEKLPRGIAKLHNLLSLRLNKCINLIQLPKDMKRLVRLRHLELDDCINLICMPCGLGTLTNLQTLTRFVVYKRNGGSARISELRDLIWLREGLEIRNLERQRNNIKEVESSKFLLHMQYLERLSLMWSSISSLDEESREEEDKDEMILDSLEPPHHNQDTRYLWISGKMLVKLRLHNCTSLASLPESIGSLTSLQKLMLHNCTSLASLPKSIGSLTSLQELSLDNCTSLSSLPESIGSLTSLQRLSLDICTSLSSLPESIGSLTSLQELSLDNCTSLSSLPESIGSLTSLQRLSLDICTSLSSLPESIGSLTSLQELSLDECTSLASLPESIGSLTSLQKLSLDNCTSLASLPESIGSLTSLQELSLYNCTSLASLSESIGSLTSLQELSLYNCTSLASLPESIGSLTSLQELRLYNCTSLASLPESIGSLTSLQKLSLHDCTSLASLPESIGSLTSLQELRLYNCTSLASLPESIGSLTSLQKLSLHDCTSLASLPESIGSLTSLQELRLYNCTSLTSLPESIGSLTSLQELSLNECTSLASLPESIGSLTSLQKLSLDDCDSLTSLPNSIKSLTSLKHLGL
ncbi:hypothetical protein K1719_013680 [Acacia pycnantha]|nr:hypothetical protein K1719_013680 [Acacia pycnantha]